MRLQSLSTLGDTREFHALPSDDGGEALKQVMLMWQVGLNAFRTWDVQLSCANPQGNKQEPLRCGIAQGEMGRKRGAAFCPAERFPKIVAGSH